MIFAPATLLEDPRVVERQFDNGTFRVYGARIQLESAEPEGPKLWCIIPGSGPGVGFSQAKGSRVWALVHAGMALAVKPLESSPLGDGNHHLHAPAGKDVLVGTAGDSWDPFMLHTGAAADIDGLKTAINTVALAVATLMNLPGGPPPAPGAGTTWLTAPSSGGGSGLVETLAAIPANKASQGAKGAIP